MSTSDEARKGELKRLEAVVENWWVSTLDAAKALVEIKSTELYKETHTSFEEYVADRWGKTKQWAYDLCNWFEINLLARCKDDNLLSMAACRPLKPLRKNPEKVRKVVAEARRIAKRQAPSVKDIEEAKREVYPPKPKAPPKFFFDVTVTGTDVNLIRNADDLSNIGTINAEDEDSFDLHNVNLNAFFRLLAETAAQNGTLKVSFGIEKHERTPAEPETQAEPTPATES